MLISEQRYHRRAQLAVCGVTVEVFLYADDYVLILPVAHLARLATPVGIIIIITLDFAVQLYGCIAMSPNVVQPGGLDARGIELQVCQCLLAFKAVCELPQ